MNQSLYLKLSSPRSNGSARKSKIFGTRTRDSGWRQTSNPLLAERAIHVALWQPTEGREAIHQSQDQKWSTTAPYAGCSLPPGKHVEIEPCHERQNHSGKSPNQQLNQPGLTPGLCF